MKHPSHPDVDRRLARVAGHLEGIRRMLADEKPCGEILQQMKAVAAALEQARRIILLDHAKHCLADIIEEGDHRAAQEELAHLINLAWK
jgi:DNA-binding FrmR family transcriptional regulator